MKNTVFLICAVFLVALALAPSALAYGGGGGFPPGYFDNPNARPGLVCKFETKELPFGKQISVPRCKVVRNAENNNNLRQRIADFLTRVQNGSR